MLDLIIIVRAFAFLTKRASNKITITMVHLTQGLLIGFFGSALYYAVDRYEPDKTMAFMLKFLVMMWRAVAIFRCIGFFGHGFF
jgi:hypothetical protein